jgi:histidinol-phosphatase (PHP family)
MVVRHAGGRVDGAELRAGGGDRAARDRVHRAPRVHGQRSRRRDRRGRHRSPLAGVEAGEPHLFAASAGAIVRGNAFERVLGSLHAVPYKGRLVAADALFGEMSDDAVMRYYFAELVDLIEGSDLFQVLAHLDFPRRYWPKGAHLYREEPFEEEYRAVLRALASSGRVLEVNTKSPLASVDQIRWWREEGGTAVSFGSDAHLPRRVGDRFKLAVDVVEAAGFKAGRDPFDFWRV